MAIGKANGNGKGQIKCKWQVSRQVVISKASDKNQGKLKGAGQVQGHGKWQVAM